MRFCDLLQRASTCRHVFLSESVCLLHVSTCLHVCFRMPSTRFHVSPHGSTRMYALLCVSTHFNMLPYTSTCPHSALTKPFTCFHLVFTELSTTQQSSVIVPLTIHLVCPRMHDEFIKSALKELRLPLYTLNGIDANALIQRRKCQEIFIGLPVCY